MDFSIFPVLAYGSGAEDLSPKSPLTENSHQA
jgi:hypothetical protein